MDSVVIDYKTAIQQVFKNYLEFLGEEDGTQFELITDQDHDRYLLVEIGWQKNRRIYGTLLHIDIIDNKLWIQQDGTEEGIANEFVELGIPKQKIVLAFKPIERRKVTDFAVA